MAGIKSYRSPKTEIRDSKIHEKGLFARESIKKGEIIAIKGGQIMTLEEFRMLDKKLQGYCAQIENDFFLGPRTEEDASEENILFTNYSCEGNVGVSGQVTFVALRDIEVGEELIHDYATMYTIKDFDMECNCGSKNCRKRFTSEDWKLKEVQERCGENFSTYILKKIKSQ